MTQQLLYQSFLAPDAGGVIRSMGRGTLLDSNIMLMSMGSGEKFAVECNNLEKLGRFNCSVFFHWFSKLCSCIGANF